MACCHCLAKVRILVWCSLCGVGGGEGEMGVENEQRNSFSVGSGYASHVGWGESAFLPSNMFSGFTTFLQSIREPRDAPFFY